MLIEAENKPTDGAHNLRLPESLINDPGLRFGTGWPISRTTRVDTRVKNDGMLTLSAKLQLSGLFKS